MSRVFPAVDYARARQPFVVLGLGLSQIFGLDADATDAAVQRISRCLSYKLLAAGCSSLRIADDLPLVDPLVAPFDKHPGFALEWLVAYDAPRGAHRVTAEARDRTRGVPVATGEALVTDHEVAVAFAAAVNSDHRSHPRLRCIADLADSVVDDASSGQVFSRDKFHLAASVVTPCYIAVALAQPRIAPWLAVQLTDALGVPETAARFDQYAKHYP